MHRSVVRFMPAMAAALVVSLLGAGSFAVAGDRGGGRDGWRGHHARGQDQSNRHGRGEHGKCCHGKRYSAWDEEWLMTSIEGDRFEIAGGQLAQQKGTGS